MGTKLLGRYIIVTIIVNVYTFAQSYQQNDLDIKDWVLGIFDPETNSQFIHVPDELTIPSPNKLYMLHRDAFQAFQKMQQAAKEDDVQLLLISALRNFTYQSRIWENHFQSIKQNNTSLLNKDICLQIMQYSAMPTTSRHHWGTDMDINSVEPEYFQSGKGLIEYQWLKKNAPKFGFCQPYSPKDDGSRIKGYNEEQWHWSYMPISFDLLNYYRNNITYQDIKGFSGSEVANTIHSIEDYVLSINSDCLNWQFVQSKLNTLKSDK